MNYSFEPVLTTDNESQQPLEPYERMGIICTEIKYIDNAMDEMAAVNQKRELTFETFTEIARNLGEGMHQYRSILYGVLTVGEQISQVGKDRLMLSMQYLYRIDPDLQQLNMYTSDQFEAFLINNPAYAEILEREEFPDIIEALGEIAHRLKQARNETAHDMHAIDPRKVYIYIKFGLPYLKICASRLSSRDTAMKTPLYNQRVKSIRS